MPSVARMVFKKKLGRPSTRTMEERKLIKKEQNGKRSLSKKQQSYPDSNMSTTTPSYQNDSETRKVEDVELKYVMQHDKISSFVKENKHFKIKLIAQLAKEFGIKPGFKKHNVRQISDKIGVSMPFVQKIVSRYVTGDNLFHQNKNKNRFSNSQVKNNFELFLKSEEYSRATPGLETVKGKPKYLLKFTKKKIIEKFLAKEGSACRYSVKTIYKHFPRNFVYPSARDLGRNACPLHANIVRTIDALHAHGIFKSVESHARSAASKVLCDNTSRSDMDPLSWSQECVFGQCNKCPNPYEAFPDVEEHKMKQEITFSIFDNRNVEYFNKKTGQNETVTKFQLHECKMTVANVIKELRSEGKKIAQHIYRAHHQWKVKKHLISNLKPGDLFYISDYQMNLSVEESMNQVPTALAYSVNKVNFAMYPIGCYLVHPQTQELTKIAITFISSDLKHTSEQVLLFETRTVEIIRSLGFPVTNVSRMTDTCTGQFRSRHTNGHLRILPTKFNLPDSAVVTNLYFEAHEGKNISDTIGSICKIAFKRSMISEINAIDSSEKVVNKIRSEVKQQTRQFSHFIAEALDDKLEVESKEESLVNISKCHSIWIDQDGILRGKELSCLACTVSTRCHECNISGNTEKENIEHKCDHCNFKGKTISGLKRHTTVKHKPNNTQLLK
jgi:hypothetical protein